MDDHVAAAEKEVEKGHSSYHKVYNTPAFCSEWERTDGRDEVSETT